MRVYAIISDASLSVAFLSLAFAFLTFFGGVDLAVDRANFVLVTGVLCVC